MSLIIHVYHGGSVLWPWKCQRRSLNRPLIHLSGSMVQYIWHTEKSCNGINIHEALGEKNKACIYQPRFSSHCLMSCSLTATYIVVTVVLFRRSTLWSPFPSRCVQTPVCSHTRLFRSEPRLRSAANPSHRWLVPVESGCWGVSQ